MTVGEGSSMLRSEQLRECFRLANSLDELAMFAVGPRCTAPYTYMLQYYLNIQAAVKASATPLTETSSDIPRGFVEMSNICLRFRRGGSKRARNELDVDLDEAIGHFRGRVRAQEREWERLGWNLPMVVETTSGAITLV
ncbi:hypothetical protein DRE_05981 [Drechslerella stenobrocha 248]|uniref:Uncharacterized protein n=1 Tax=Drechslerella stenobrocha 248 TaxID=1043628 RepID=W7HQ25_9PEZI|nr:hypothetical protein DRE_05981 [Drechslerella stenobrocha 248]